MIDFDQDRMRLMPDGSFVIDIATLEGPLEGMVVKVSDHRLRLECYTNGEEVNVLDQMWDEWYCYIVEGDAPGIPVELMKAQVAVSALEGEIVELRSELMLRRDPALDCVIDAINQKWPHLEQYGLQR